MELIAERMVSQEQERPWIGMLGLELSGHLLGTLLSGHSTILDYDFFFIYRLKS